MVYEINPKMLRLRARAVRMVEQGQSIRAVARYFGYHPSTVMRWIRKTPLAGAHEIPTESSRPNSHPNQTPNEIIERIIELRRETGGRCAEVVHQHLLDEGITVSLSTVKRILDRKGLTNKINPYKRRHKSVPRPPANNPGELVEIDTIHLYELDRSRIYVYTLLDVFSRWAFAMASERINTHNTIKFVRLACRKSPFEFRCLQSDNGPEFSQNFTERIKITHRHSRVRRPNDNAHLERFNRTIQQEFLNQMPNDVSKINKHLPQYLNHYNTKRLHLGINLKTPIQMTHGCCQAID